MSQRSETDGRAADKLRERTRVQGGIMEGIDMFIFFDPADRECPWIITPCCDLLRDPPGVSVTERVTQTVRKQLMPLRYFDGQTPVHRYFFTRVESGRPLN